MKPPDGWGQFRVVEESVPERPATRSYDHQGKRLDWWGVDAPAIACDLEHRSRRLDPVIEELAPEGLDPLRFWTEAEVRAKLGDIPILDLLVNGHVSKKVIEILTLDLPSGHVACFGRVVR